MGYWMTGTEAPLIELGWIGPTGQMFSTIADLNKVSQDKQGLGMPLISLTCVDHLFSVTASV